MMANQPVQDIELKETYDRKRFLELVQQWGQAMERNRDLQVFVDGREFTIPADAVERGRLRVEYEIDEGDCEFQLTLKWR